MLVVAVAAGALAETGKEMRKPILTLPIPVAGVEGSAESLRADLVELVFELPTERRRSPELATENEQSIVAEMRPFVEPFP